MTLTDPRTTIPDAADGTASVTPTVRQAARRGVFWVVLAIIAVGFVIVTALLRGGVGSAGIPLAADNAGLAGSQAIVEVLRDSGVDVIPVGTLDAARDAAGPDATLFFSDPGGYLAVDQLSEIVDLAADTVVADPDFAALQAVTDGVVRAGGVPDAVTADARCSVPAAERAGTATLGEKSLAIADVSTDWAGCFASGDSWALLQQQSDASTLSLLADGSQLRNDTIAAEGNAALALSLLGQHPTLIWYQPTLADVVGGAAPSLGELSPDWVTPVVALLGLVVVAAAVWQGRRFGSLVVENLPVTVHAGETREGRARLYARTSSRLRAADALRIGTIGRLASRLGLARTASVDEVVGAAAAATGRQVSDVRGLLIDTRPDSDRSLVDLSGRLVDLERAVTAATEVGAAAAAAAAPTSAPPSTERMGS
ncbi:MULTISPECIES: DUF4350 domain-containing protein [unclassified Leifsonia]|uniref:DUF4350 domain-containing protein n=1 Tax=unclassified Leifsonia TaxID=2663824 RepID=UPI0006F5E3EB|nr:MULTISPECIES: DUF4350 domain-containing protein [unclassified Leifsonia]KQX06437.1 hypothetical protein ASC59_00715 [Leifsonia sp. Root1293]KRA10720.1 hypothetical protein ASD61_00715 [Leifsonia sp. Root60]